MHKSIIFSTIVLFFTAMIQSAIISNIVFLPAIPDLMLIVCLYFSLLNGRTFGEITGFISGLFLDFLSGCPFGLNCLLRTLIGYIAGFFGKTVSFKGFLMPFLIGLIATLVKAFLIWFISLFFPNYVNNYNVFSLEFLFELIFNAIFTPIIFKLLSNFNKYISLSSGEID